MNPVIFRRVIMRYMILMWIPFVLLFLLVGLNNLLGQDVLDPINVHFLGLPLLTTNGTANLSGFAGVGIISIGGLAVGLLAFGGGAIGLLACGGGALGIIAVGGGAIGLIAMGGGSIGFIAIGGGAFGRYVLAGDGAGKYVLSYKRQDPEAVRFFCKYLPRLQEAFKGDHVATIDK